MKQTFDTDDTLYGLLKASTALTSSITGGLYVNGERPDNSELEDIVVSTIALTQDSTPQLGVSANRKRLKELTTSVLAILSAASVTGLTFWVENQSVIKEIDSSQHFVNLRIGWNIH
jgi:hypothetical protein